MAEVLITLAVVGIVAALTIPTLLRNYHKKQTITQLQIAYNTINQGIRMAIVDYGDVKTWELPIKNDTQTVKPFVDKYIIPYFKGAYSSPELYDQTGLGYKAPNLPIQIGGRVYGLTSPSYYPVSLINGIFYYASASAHEDTILFTVDLNGPSQKPNIYGKDIFQLTLVPEKNAVYMSLYNYPLRENSGKYLYCKTDISLGCGYVIYANNWKIPDDYPVEF